MRYAVLRVIQRHSLLPEEGQRVDGNDAAQGLACDRRLERVVGSRTQSDAADLSGGPFPSQVFNSHRDIVHGVCGVDPVFRTTRARRAIANACDIQAHCNAALLREVARQRHVEAAGADPGHGTRIYQQHCLETRGPLFWQRLFGGAHDCEQSLRPRQPHRPLDDRTAGFVADERFRPCTGWECGMASMGSGLRFFTQRLRLFAGEVPQPPQGRTDDCIGHDTVVGVEHHFRIAGYSFVIDTCSAVAQVLGPALVRGKLGAIQNEHPGRRGLFEACQVNGAQGRLGLRAQQEAGRLQHAVILGMNDVALGLDGSAQQAQLPDIRTATDHRRNGNQASCARIGLERCERRQQRPESDARETHSLDTCPLLQRLRRKANAAKPLVHALWIEVISGRVACAVIVESECRYTHPGRVLGQVADRAVGADGLIAKRAADHQADRGCRGGSFGIMQPTEKRALGRAEVDRVIGLGR